MVVWHTQAEIEKEKLASILAAGTATQEQIMRQEQIAKAAEENAMREAERLVMRNIEFEKSHKWWKQNVFSKSY